MRKCIRTDNLGVYHKQRDGGTGIENTQVLCQSCLDLKNTYDKNGKSLPSFSKEIKEDALKRAENCCECEKEGCHYSDKELNEAIKNATNKSSHLH